MKNLDELKKNTSNSTKMNSKVSHLSMRHFLFPNYACIPPKHTETAKLLKKSFKVSASVLLLFLFKTNLSYPSYFFLNQSLKNKAILPNDYLPLIAEMILLIPSNQLGPN